jgi:hypothetical protein
MSLTQEDIKLGVNRKVYEVEGKNDKFVPVPN